HGGGCGDGDAAAMGEHAARARVQRRAPADSPCRSAIRRFRACHRPETRRVNVPPALLAKLKCPITGLDLRVDGGSLVTVDGARRYPVSPSGVPLFGDAWLSQEGAVQSAPYDRIAHGYLDNRISP